MNLVSPSASNVRLSDFAGEVVAIQPVGRERQVPVHIDGEDSMAPAVPAFLFTFSSDGKRQDHGRTNIFPTVIRQQLSELPPSDPDAALYGTLEWTDSKNGLKYLRITELGA